MRTSARRAACSRHTVHRFLTRSRVAAVTAALLLATVELLAQSAKCRDGSMSYSATRRGTCSGHGGVVTWILPSVATPAPPPPAATGVSLASPSAAAIARDARGRIQRSAAARHAFARQTGFPSGRPGYIVDHIVPLACGGADAPRNMQWQTLAAAKLKDKTERAGC